MYIPKSFEENDKQKIYDVMEKNSFAILFSKEGEELSATHLPLLFNRDEGYLYGHMAKANNHWENIDGEVLVVFSGAHSYISPSWYETLQAVPTWNYVAVHVYGDFKLISDNQRLIKMLNESVSYYELGMHNPWDMSKADSSFLDNLSKGIVGFEIHITKIESKSKLSQNHSIERQNRVISALEMQGDENSIQIASLMKGNLSSNI